MVYLYLNSGNQNKNNRKLCINKIKLKSYRALWYWDIEDDEKKDTHTKTEKPQFSYNFYSSPGLLKIEIYLKYKMMLFVCDVRLWIQEVAQEIRKITPFFVVRIFLTLDGIQSEAHLNLIFYKQFLHLCEAYLCVCVLLFLGILWEIDNNNNVLFAWHGSWVPALKRKKSYLGWKDSILGGFVRDLCDEISQLL